MKSYTIMGPFLWGLSSLGIHISKHFRSSRNAQNLLHTQNLQDALLFYNQSTNNLTNDTKPKHCFNADEFTTGVKNWIMEMALLLVRVLQKKQNQ